MKDCIKFLCREARINDAPFNENGFLVYTVPHQCYYSNPPTDKAPPPPYSEGSSPITPDSALDHDYDIAEFIEASNFVSPGREHDPSSEQPRKPRSPVFKFPDEVWGDYSSGSGPASTKKQPPITESVILSDVPAADINSDLADLPPRTIPRQNPVTSVPSDHSQSLPSHIFNNSTPEGNYCLEAPYQINSRIIFTQSGEVQYERNILGNNPHHHHHHQTDTAQLLRKSFPLPPRNIVREEREERRGGEAGSGTEFGTVGGEGVAAGEGGMVTEGKEGVGTGMVTRVKGASREERGMVGTDKFGEGWGSTMRGFEGAFDTLGFETNTTPGGVPRVAAVTTSQSYPQTYTHGTPVGSELFSGNRPLNQSENVSSVVTTLFSTRAPPTSHEATPPYSSIAARRMLAVAPPSLFSRTASDSRSHLSRDRGQRRASFVSQSQASQSPTTDDNEEDNCYVLVAPHSASHKTLSSSSSTSSLSPSYIRESQLLAMEQNRIGATSAPPPPSNADKSYNDVFEESANTSPLSLADAGDVVREDWMYSLQQLRLSQERSVSESVLPLSDVMDLDEVAFLEYRKNRRSGCLSCGDYVDESAFMVSPHSRYGGTHWRMGSSSEDEEEELSLLADFDGQRINIPFGTSRSLPQQYVRPAAHAASSETAKPRPHPDSAVVEKRHRDRESDISYHRPRSQHISKKPAIRPRSKAGNASSVGNSKASAQFQSTASTNFESSSSKPNHLSPGMLDTGKHQHSVTRYSTGMDYIQSSIPVYTQQKPVPTPRAPHRIGVKSSAQASMVTLSVKQWSSSESDLLDAVLNESEAVESKLYWDQPGEPLSHKFHSSTELAQLSDE